MAKFLNLGRVMLPADDASGAPAGTTYGDPIARPTGQRSIPVQYANAAQMVSTQQFTPVQQMQPANEPTPPTMPPTQTPDVQDPGLVCPAGTLFDAATNRCIPQYPVPQPPAPQPGYPAPAAGAGPATTTGVPPGYFALFGRVYPKWWAYLAGGTLGFGTLLLIIFAARRSGRRSSAA